MNRQRPSLAGRAPTAARAAGDRRRRSHPAGWPRRTDHPPGTPDRCAGQARPTGPGADGAARRWPADRHDPGRRDRRHRPLPERPQAMRLGGADPGGAQLATARSATATSPNRAPRGCAGFCKKPPRPPSYAPCWPPPTPSSPAAAASRSPRWRSPVGCWLAASTSSTNWRSPPPEKARSPGALVTNRMRLQHGRLC